VCVYIYIYIYSGNMSVPFPLNILPSSLSINMYLSHLYPKLAHILSLNRNKGKLT